MKRLIFSLLAIVFVNTIAFSQSITNVVAETVGETIQLNYKIQNGSGITFLISAYYSLDGVNFTEMTSVSGAIGKNLGTKETKTIYWDVLSDLEQLSGENIVFKVKGIYQVGNTNTVISSDLSFEFDDYSVEINSCKVMGEKLIIYFTITNNGIDRELLFENSQTRIYDNRGFEFEPASAKIGNIDNHYGKTTARLVTGVPVKSEIVFEGDAKNATTIKLLDIYFDKNSYKVRDIPVNR